MSQLRIVVFIEPPRMAAVASLIVGNAAVRNTLRGDFPADSSPQFQVLLDFARNLTLSPEGGTAQDFVPLQSSGLNRVPVTQGILIVVGFNLINRIADAFHFETPSAAEYLPSVRFLRCFGYGDLAGPRLPFQSAPWLALLPVIPSDETVTLRLS
jgi:hypothetical protein